MISPLIEHVVKQMVDHTDQVRVSVSTDDQKTTIDLQVAADDVKRVIGKEGRVIRSLRLLARAFDDHDELDIVVSS